MILFAILVLTCAFLCFVFYKNKTADYWKKRNVVQVNGTFWKFVLGNKPLPEVYKEVYSNYPNEPYVGIFTGGRPTLLVRDLENVQAVLAGDFHSFYSRGIPYNPNDLLSDNVLFINDYKRWKILRQKLSPIFTSMKLKNMYYIIDKCAQDFVERVKENPGSVQKPYDALITYTTASVTAAVFGLDAQTKNMMDSPLVEAAKKSFELTLYSRVINTIANLFPRFLTAFNVKTFGKYENFFIGVLRNLIEDRKISKEKRHDFVDLCVELQQQGMMKDTATGYELEPSVEILAAQAYFFFLAGTDTSANTMNATLLELSNNPDILKKVHEEIDKVFESCNEKLSFNEIENLNYLDMVINEALRKYPPIGLTQRRCTKDTVLPAGGVKVEKDSLVVVPILGLHRDKQYYPNPDVFDPERFSPENAENIPKFANLSFGEGNRVCLGTRFARLQVKAGLAWLLRKFTLRHQSAEPNFEASFFGLKDVNLRYDLLSRNV